MITTAGKLPLNLNRRDLAARALLQETQVDPQTSPKILQAMEHWGYHLLPKAHPACPGYGGLMVAIRDQPTGRHFDPETIRLQLANGRNGPEWTTLKLQPLFSGSRFVWPGRITLTDRIDKQVNFFIFGGSLEATVSSQQTVYNLITEAPVLVLTEELTDIPDRLYSEVEGLLARRGRAWNQNGQRFLHFLAKADTFQFYLMCLQLVLERYHEHRILRQTWREFYLAILQEKARLVEAGLWPAALLIE
jgi:hypothetical protein